MVVNAQGNHSRTVLPPCPVPSPGLLPLEGTTKGHPVLKHHYLWALIASAEPKLT